MRLPADKWKKKSKSSSFQGGSSCNSRCKLQVCTILFICVLFFSIKYYSLPTSISISRSEPESSLPTSISVSRSKSESKEVPVGAGEYPQCSTQNENRPTPDSLKGLPKAEKYMWFAPHSGFSNQVGELKNALIIAAILNRTLIIPPILDHHAMALGSCPKFRVQPAHELRNSVWDHVIHLMQSSRYWVILFGTKQDKETVNITTNRINRLFFKVRSLRMSGSCALNLCGVACGRLDITYELGFGGPWDVAARVVIIQGASMESLWSADLFL